MDPNDHTLTFLLTIQDDPAESSTNFRRPAHTCSYVWAWTRWGKRPRFPWHLIPISVGPFTASPSPVLLLSCCTHQDYQAPRTSDSFFRSSEWHPSNVRNRRLLETKCSMFTAEKIHPRDVRVAQGQAAGQGESRAQGPGHPPRSLTDVPSDGPGNTSNKSGLQWQWLTAISQTETGEELRQQGRCQVKARGEALLEMDQAGWATSSDYPQGGS